MTVYKLSTDMIPSDEASVHMHRLLPTAKTPRGEEQLGNYFINDWMDPPPSNLNQYIFRV